MAQGRLHQDEAQEARTLEQAVPSSVTNVLQRAVKPGTVAYTCNLGISEAKAGRSRVLSQPGLHRERECAQKRRHRG